MMEARCRISIWLHTVSVKGARSPDPDAEATGRCIKMTKSVSPRMTDGEATLRVLGVTGSKAAAMSAF